MTRSMAWGTLLNYESRELVKQRFNERNSRTLSTEHADEIRHSITQARQYFDSAAIADRVVRPLLIYYGVLGLSRAFVMFATKAREATLSQSHGISVLSWTNTLSSASGDLGDLQIRLNDSGSLVELVRATSNVSIVRNNSSAGNLVYPHSVVKLPFDLDLSDILSRIPEISEPYRRWRGRVNFLRFNRVDRDGPTVEVRVRKSDHNPEGIDHVKEGLAEGEMTDFKESSAYWHATFPKAFHGLPMLWDEYDQVFGTVGDLVFVRRIRGSELSKGAAMFISAYILGMLVRYYPSKWIGLLTNGRADRSLPTLLFLVEYIEKYFPSMILEFFEADRFDRNEAVR